MQRRFFRIYPSGGNPPNHWYFQFEQLVNNMEQAKQSLAQNQDQQHFRDFLDSIERVITILGQHRNDAWGGDVIHHLTDSGKRWQQVDNVFTQGIRNNRPFAEIMQELIQTNNLKYLLNSVYKLLRHLSKNAPLTVKDIVSALEQENLFRDIKNIFKSLTEIRDEIRDLVQKLPQPVQQAAAPDLNPILNRLNEINDSLEKRLQGIEGRLSSMANVGDIQTELNKLYKDMLDLTDECLVELLGKIKKLLPSNFIKRFEVVETDLKDIKIWIADLHTLVPLLDKINVGWDELEKLVKQIAKRNENIEKKMKEFNERLKKISADMAGDKLKGAEAAIQVDSLKKLAYLFRWNRDARGYIGLLGELIKKENESRLKKVFGGGGYGGTATHRNGILDNDYAALELFFNLRRELLPTHVGRFALREEFFQDSRDNMFKGHLFSGKRQRYLVSLLLNKEPNAEILARLTRFLKYFNNILRILAKKDRGLRGYVNDLSNILREIDSYSGVGEGSIRKLVILFYFNFRFVGATGRHTLRSRMERTIEHLLKHEVGKKEEVKEISTVSADTESLKKILEELMSFKPPPRGISAFSFYKDHIILRKGSTMVRKLFHAGAKLEIIPRLLQAVQKVNKDRTSIESKPDGRKLLKKFDDAIKKIEKKFEEIDDDMKDGGLIDEINKEILKENKFTRQLKTTKGAWKKSYRIVERAVEKIMRYTDRKIIDATEIENFVYGHKKKFKPRLDNLIKKFQELYDLIVSLREIILKIAQLY